MQSFTFWSVNKKYQKYLLDTWVEVYSSSIVEMISHAYHPIGALLNNLCVIDSWNLSLSATSWACVGFSFEEERVMQQSRDKYFPQLENQGINSVGDNSQITNTCTNNQTLAPNVINGLSIPSQSLAKVRSDRDR